MTLFTVGTLAERDALVYWYAPFVWLFWVGRANDANGFWYTPEGGTFSPGTQYGDRVYVRETETKYYLSEEDIYNPVLTWTTIPSFGFETSNASGERRLSCFDPIGSVVYTKYLAPDESGSWYPDYSSDGMVSMCQFTNFYPIVIPQSTAYNVNYTRNLTHGVSEGLPIQWWPIWGTGDTGHSMGSFLFIIGITKPY
jgi:hypothetical protein